METILALSARQWKRHLRRRSRVVASLFQPLLFLLALGFGLRPVFEQAHQQDYLQFLAPGVIAMSIMSTAIACGAELIHDRQMGIIKATLVAPVTRLEIMLGCTIGGAITALIQGAIIGLACVIAGFQVSGLSTIFIAFAVALMLAIMFAAFAVTIGAIFNDDQSFRLIINFLIMPMFLMSGALFPLPGLPRPLAIFVYFNPLTYGVDGLRGALTGSWHIGLAIDLTIVTCLSVVFSMAGAFAFLRMRT